MHSIPARLAFVLAGALLNPFVLPAQTPGKPAASAQVATRADFLAPEPAVTSRPVTVRAAGAPTGCPVGMRVQRTGAGAVMYAGRDAGSISGADVSQKIHLSFNAQQKRVVAAVVTVHGYSAEVRAMPAANAGGAVVGGAGTADAGSISQTVHLQLSSGKSSATDVLLQSFAAVSRVDLESLTYADGTKWTAGSRNACQVEPDRLVLVAGR